MSINHEKIAEIAGVSPATVSRVVNGRAGVSPERAELVRKVMSDLNYDPVPVDQRMGRQGSPIGGSGAGGKTQSIGVVILDELYQFAPNLFASQLRGIEAGAAEHGFNAVVTHASRVEDLAPAVAEGQVDGLILMGSMSCSTLGDRLAKLPRVWLNSHHEAGGDAVLAGNHQVGELAADYLLELGHRELGFLCAMADYPPYPTRSSAFRFRVQERESTARVQQFTATTASAAYRDLDVHRDGFDVLRQQIDPLVEQLLDQSPRVTGLFVPNDLMTAIVYSALTQRGIRPGEDVQIVSCNNEMSCLVGLHPRPATIDVGAEAIGRRGIEQLLWRMRHPEDDRPSSLAVTPLLVRP